MTDTTASTTDEFEAQLTESVDGFGPGGGRKASGLRRFDLMEMCCVRTGGIQRLDWGCCPPAIRGRFGQVLGDF
jgi:hypothetical protein